MVDKRNYVFRSPPGKGGKGELADALVLFDDTMIMVQVKAQVSERDPKAWSRKNIEKALKQVSYTHRMLTEGHVRDVQSEDLGSAAFDPACFPHRHGLIIVHQDKCEPFDPLDLVPELADQTFPVHVFTLADFIEVARRFDTAGDFIVYLEMRTGMAPRPLHGEVAVARALGTSIETILRGHDPSITAEVLARSAAAFRAKVDGTVMLGEDWKYGLLIDDIIAHLRHPAPELPWCDDLSREQVRKLVSRFAWLTREQRIKVGHRLHRLTLKKETDWFRHIIPRQRQCFVYMVAVEERQEATRFLNGLVHAAKVWTEGVDEVIGLSTNPIGHPKPGRAYSVAYLHGPVANDVAEVIRSGPNPFE